MNCLFIFFRKCKRNCTAVHQQSCYICLVIVWHNAHFWQGLRKVWWNSLKFYIEYIYIDGLVQERRNSIANALELRISCSNPSICLSSNICLILMGPVSFWRTLQRYHLTHCGQRFGSTLAQIMACCHTAPSHYLNQCWLIISEVQWPSSEEQFHKKYLSH